MTEESAVKVCVRVRPLIEREEKAATENAEPVQLFWKTDKKSIYQIDNGNSTKSFGFDRVFTSDETTNQLYQDIAKPLVVSSVEGYNGTIFAYGQTSSGKTFTMMGSSRNPGVIPLAVEDVFQTITKFPNKEFLLRVSYMEIYNETVSDLLVDSSKRKPLEVRETINKNIFVSDLTEELVTSSAQALAWIRKGEKNRHYEKTSMNQRSSRSHAIFRMILESREKSDPASGENADGAILVSNLNLVDLAGSERASQTGAEGARFKEGCNINRSLFVLGQVIKKLTDESQKGFTNYRDSKLTRILQNSLGGNAKTVIICTITPATLDETLSTLQFASTAKKMKNDPYVTEVSDDGALLKRYRNEIVDLKRRLHEVSSGTQTTATEKKVLSQMLQEKDQLQREQEDRIRNLTKLLVTSSNLVPVQKMPKRRVTWGGKMLRLAPPSACDGGSSALSFAESFNRKRKADRSCLTEIGEDDDDFQWEIPDEPSYDMEMSQNFVSVRRSDESSYDSPKDFVSPDRMRELSGKVSALELQLELESQQKEEALTKVESLRGRLAELELHLQTEGQQKPEALEKMQTTEQNVAELELQLQTEALENIQTSDQRVAELELQLQTEALQKQDALEKMQTSDQRVAELELQLQLQTEVLENMQTSDQRLAELELQLQTEAQQKLEATEKVAMLDLRVADLERQLEDQSHTLNKTDQQTRKDFAETIQLCETLATEKDMIVAERDYLKQEISMFIEQTQSLEKENAALSQEMATKRELEEFKSLEEEFRKEHENELQNEISQLKKTVESSTLQCLELQNKLETLSEELKKKTEFAEELQSMSGKDLVQEVAKLRRSLDDAEGLSRDTKKEWAVLRSQNIATEEMNMTLNANYDKMEAEVKSLRFQLETEKSHFRKMQSDLQKELNVVFAENTKLTALLDGNVPKNLIDSIELERTAAQLNRELTASQEAEGALRAQLEELASLQPLPAKVENLTKQLNQLTEELQCVRAEKDALLSEKDAGAPSSAEEMEKLLSAVTSLTAERDQLMRDRQENVEMAAETQVLLHSLQEELQEQRHKNSDLVKLCEQKESDLGEHMHSLSQDLQSVRAEKDTLLSEQNACAQSHAEEMEKLRSTLASLTAERDQLQMDMQENVEIMIENQEELRTAIEKNREQKERIKQLETAQTSKQDGPPNEMSAQIEELQTRMMENQEELRVSQEKIRQLQDEISVLTSQKAELEGRPSNGSDAEITLQNQIQRLTEELESVRAERDSVLSERTADTHSEEMEKLLCRVTSLSEERDQLQEILEGLRQEKNQLRAELEDRMEMVVQAQSGFNQPEILTSELQPHDEKNTHLQQEMMENQGELRASQEKIRRLQDEINSLLSERTTDTQTHSEEMEKLLCRVTSHSEERDQLQEILEGLRQEKNQLRAELEDRMETMQTEMMENQEKLRVSQEKIRQLQDEISVLTSQKAELEGRPSNERDVEITLQLQELQNQTQRLTEELESVRAERDSVLSERLADTHSEEMEKLLCRVTSLSEERDQLQEILEGLRQEKNQLRAELEDRMETMQTEMMENQEELRVSQEKSRVLQDEISVLMSQKAELEGRPSNERDAEITLQLQELQNQTQRLTEELESVRAERDSVLSERTADTHSEEMGKLLCRVTSLSEERDQLQEILEGLRQEKNQLRAELEDRMETMQTEIAQLNMSLQSVTEQKSQLENYLQQNMNMASTTQERLTSVQEELCAQKRINSDLEKLCQEKECSLDQQMRTLTEKLESIEAERDSLLSEKEANCQTATEEMEKLLCRVKSLSEERDQLQEILEGLRQEKNQLRAELEDRMETMQTEMRTLTEKLESIEAERDRLLSKEEANCQTSTKETEKLLYKVNYLREEREQLQQLLEGQRREKNRLKAELEDRMEMISAIQEKLREQEDLNSQQQAEGGERETKLQQRVQQLEEQLEMLRERQSHAVVDADASQQLLSEANTTISALKEQLSTSGVKETVSSRLQDSTEQLQESFRKLQHFIDTCSKSKFTDPVEIQSAVKHSYLNSLPEPTKKAYIALCQVRQQAAECGRNIRLHLQAQARGYRKQFEELVKKDLAVFEERRLQDVLLCRAQAPCYSVKDEDFNTLWDHRLTELLDKRQLYLQKMTSILEKLWANMTTYPSELSAEIRDGKRFKEQLQAMLTNEPINFSRMDSILSCELEHTSAVARTRRSTLQGIIDEQNGLQEELKLLEDQANSQLGEERSKSSTLLQALEGAPLKTELSLLKDNQQLLLQLQQTEEKVKALRVQTEKLEDAQIKASNRVSNHKQATQLLQTELQDCRAEVEEKDQAIQTLRSKLRESEDHLKKNASPSAVELENLRTKLFKMEVALSSASDKHKEEIQRMTTLLKEKEESLRKLKETLRRSQQQGEVSILQGEDLHARLTNPRGLGIKTSILQEKTKLEEEVKTLHVKITELQSLVSSQQAEITKWKGRAIKLKVKSKGEVDKPSSPCTPTKRGLPMTSDPSSSLSSPAKFLVTPRRVLDSPRKPLDSPNVLESPKSRFFDAGGASDVLSRTRPKQFFDNSSLGTIPDVFNVPESPDEKNDAIADRKEDLWPKSPSGQEEMCKTQ
ncbi:centromere-associated protein E isoform X6 [Sander lucioperca]|uniref:centromere-associated protein E isoform X6 n=1 Tax=Sander lucioperca TaxID=283035 RepID=UPI00125D9273|nr:centromere-associated protein E isoform X6 [Sander lucioperca]